MEPKNKKILLTGGAGFIGTALTERLIDDNEIVIYDNFHRNAMKNTKLIRHPDLHIIKGDVLDMNGIKKAMVDCDIVVHLAAIAGVDTVLKMPVKTMKVNMIGTYNILETSLEQKVERFIDFSTSEVFGSFAYRVQEGDATTLGAVGEARWTYAISKLATEHLAHNYYKEYGLSTVSIRPFNIYGPGQIGEGAIQVFIKKAIRNEPLQIHGNGGQIRAWCYIEDIIEGVLLCLEKKEAVGEVFNIGNPRSTMTIYNLAKEVVRLSGSSSRIMFIDWPHPDVDLRIPNIDKARKLLGFEPRVDLQEGIGRTIEWYRGQK